MRQDIAQKPLSLIRDTVEFIEANLDQDLRLEVLALREGLSPGHFQRIFRREVGESPKQFVRRLRIERAARVLRGSSLSVTDVAFDSSFESHEGFTRAFRLRFGAPPTEFRENNRPAPDHLPVTVTVECLPPRRFAYVRHVGPYPETPDVLTQLRRWAGTAGLDADADGVAVFWDDQSVTEPQHTRSDVGLVLPDDVPLPDVASCRIGSRVLPVRERAAYPHDVAVLRREGPYSAKEVRKLHEFLGWHWLPRSRWRFSARQPSFEVYSGATDWASASLVTDICVPVVRRRARGGSTARP